MEKERHTTVRLDPAELDALSSEVAKLVEDKLIAKASKVLLANLGVLATLLLGGASAYWHLEKQVDGAKQVVSAHDARLNMMVVESNGFRQNIETKLESISYKTDEINRFLRDHMILDRTRNVHEIPSSRR